MSEHLDSSLKAYLKKQKSQYPTPFNSFQLQPNKTPLSHHPSEFTQIKMSYKISLSYISIKFITRKILWSGIVRIVKSVLRKVMLAKNVTIRKLIGHVLLVIFVIRLAILWRDVGQVWTRHIGGMYRKGMRVNVGIKRSAGDATIVISTILRVMLVNVETSKWTGVARIATEM